MSKISLHLYQDHEWAGSDPDKPLKSAQIARLGDTLDEVESLPAWRSQRWDAEMDYFLALRDRVLFEVFKADSIKRVPSRRDGQRIYDEWLTADLRWAKLMEAVSKARHDRRVSIGSTMRERLDARAALALLDSKLKIARRKFRQAKMQDEADKLAGIVRIQHQRKPSMVHL